MLLHFLPNFRLQVVFGGTNIRSDLSKLKRQTPDLLVATPGRLNDLLENHGLQQQMQGIRVVKPICASTVSVIKHLCLQLSTTMYC